METVSISMILEILRNFGPIGLIAVMWWVDTRNTRKIIDENKRYNDEVLTGYRKDIAEIREMYKNNVQLVEKYVELARDYKSLTKDLKDAYILNTQAFQRLSDDVEGNEFCPHVRLQKKASGVVG
jgi:hypothetical protein